MNGTNGCGGKLRPEVERFAWAMEMKLRKNDHKGHWSGCTNAYLLRRLVGETEELRLAMLGPDGQKSLTVAEAEYIIREAADVANFAMMIADNARREFALWPEDVGLAAEAGK